jgi:hypothetical protein
MAYYSFLCNTIKEAEWITAPPLQNVTIYFAYVPDAKAEMGVKARVDVRNWAFSWTAALILPLPRDASSAT